MIDPTLTAPNLDLLDRLPLHYGSHTSNDQRIDGLPQCCAREAIAYCLTGKATDKTPPCCTLALAALPALNDACGPGDKGDALRAELIRPWLRRLATTPRNDARDRRVAEALAMYACTVCAADAMEFVGFPDHAAALRACTTLDGAYAAAYRAARAAVADSAAAFCVADSAARAAAAAACDAAADAALTAAAAAARAIAVADAATATKKARRRRYIPDMLRIIVETP